MNKKSNFAVQRKRIFMSTILQCESVSKSIGDMVLFENASFVVNQGEKVALLGVNGVGKSTLLNLIAGEDSPDSGSIHVANGIKMSYLLQENKLPENSTVMQALFTSENENVQKIRDYEEALISNNVSDIEKTGSAIDRLGLWDFETRIKQILTQLHIENYSVKIRELSGGQKKRVALANVLLNEPDFLILDEPTNHLDLNLIEWLEKYIQKTSMTILMVTHDRFFLDRVCNILLEIDQKSLYSYKGNYSHFVAQREKRIKIEAQEVEKAQNLLRKEQDWMNRMPKARGTKAKHRVENYYNLRKKSSEKRSDQLININIQESRLGKKILVAKNLDFFWNKDCYLKDFSYTFSRYEKIGIIGNNGTGKTTFLEILSRNLQPASGTIETGDTIKFGYFKQSGMKFNEDMKVLDALTSIAETITISNGNSITASQFLNYFLFPPKRQHDYIYKLSGGEKRRLYLCQILMQNPNFLILDEPTNDLDIATLQVLEEYLNSFNGCVLVVSHDRYFMDRVVDHIFVFKEKANLKDFPGNYSAYFNWKKKHLNIKTEILPKKEKPSLNKNKNKLSFNEKQELEALEVEIELLESEQLEIETQLNSGTLQMEQLTEKSMRIGIIIEELETKTLRWIALNEKISD